jgi:hypothetical protein
MQVRLDEGFTDESRTRWATPLHAQDPPTEHRLGPRLEAVASRVERPAVHDPRIAHDLPVSSKPHIQQQPVAA